MLSIFKRMEFSGFLRLIEEDRWTKKDLDWDLFVFDAISKVDLVSNIWGFEIVKLLLNMLGGTGVSYSMLLSLAM